MSSLRGRLSLRLVGISALLLIAVGLALRLFVGAWLEEETDDALEAKARALITLTQQEPPRVELEFADEFMPEFEREDQPEYFEIWLLDGSVLERSRSLAGADLPRREDLQVEAQFSDLRLPDGRWGRGVQIDFVPQLGNGSRDHLVLPTDPRMLPLGSGLQGASLVVAQGREELDSRLRHLSLVLWVGVAGLLATITLVIPPVVRNGLRPLQQMGRQVEAMNARSLHSRLALEDPVEELQPVLNRLNALLDRIEEAFERERLLSSNLAHELRTPIAELRNLAEVGSRWPEEAQAVEAYFRDVQQISELMERAVGQLLLLARSEGGHEAVELGLLDIGEVLAACCARQQLAARQRGVELVQDVPAGLQLRSDRAKLEIIFSNLLANAVAYSPEGGRVLCRATRGRASDCVVEVSNTALGLEEADLPLLAGRFWRKDPSRTGGQNLGLGLTLVRTLAELLGATVEFRLSRDKVFTVTLMVPDSPRPAG
ncbi:MAG: hypothetical protein KDD47_05620 [Acidobacteria bacterium]|nr:hypothetical protein [Acidobacteriota bacterium]